MIELLLNPAVPSILMGLWVLSWWSGRTHPPLLPTMDRRNARPGDVSLGGSAATSKVEQRIRDHIERSGFRTYPQGTLLCAGRDSAGKKRFFTPDILMHRPRLVVEVDPEHTHGGADKIAEDIMRNRFYASLGLKVVRVRIGGVEALSPNDVVITDRDFRADRHGAQLLAALGSARRLPPHYWTRRNADFSR